MARQSKILTDLRCNDCGHRFEGWAWYGPPPRTEDRANIPGLWATENAARDNWCPNPECHSGAIRVVRTIIYPDT